MHLLPCTNPICSDPLDRNSAKTGLCYDCRGAMIRRLLPACGYIPCTALSSLSANLRHNLNPTSQDQTAAVSLMRGPRYRTGPWDKRPVYSHPVLETLNPKPKMSRRIPEILIGRRRTPNVPAILSAYCHFVLATNVLGLPKEPALFLAGATYYRRKDTQRPTGQRREYRGRIVRNSHRLTYYEFAALGRLVLRAAGILGVDRRYDPEITASYLKGVDHGIFNPPVIVHPNFQPTLASGDSVFDHVVDLNCAYAPQYRRQTRRASGLMARTKEWPSLLNRSLEEVQRDLKAQRDAKAAVFKVATTADVPDTDWLFK